MNIIRKICQLFLIGGSFLQSAGIDFSALDSLMLSGIKDKIFPGAVVLINHHGKRIYYKPFGRYTYDKTSPKISIDTLFDVASLTKVLATTTLAMQLHDKNMLDVEKTVSEYLPQFNTADKANICIKHLLTHTSGFVDKPLRNVRITASDLLQELLSYKPRFQVGDKYQYTCCNMLYIQKIIENLLGLPFDECFNRYIKNPLGLTETGFNPKNSNRCAPTQSHGYRGSIQGVVHDDKAYICNGVAGNAGLFSTARDLEKFMLMIMNDGKYMKDKISHQLIRPETIRTWTSKQCDFNRGLGWEIGRHLSSQAFGHFGWTGVSIWADRDLDLFVILLTNRTYPDGKNLAIRQFRIDFHDLIMKIISQ